MKLHKKSEFHSWYIHISFMHRVISNQNLNETEMLYGNVIVPRAQGNIRSKWIEEEEEKKNVQQKNDSRVNFSMGGRDMRFRSCAS